MVKKNILLVLILLSFYILNFWQKQIGIMGKAFAQQHGRQSGNRISPAKRRGGDLSAEIKELLDLEKEGPTNSQNVRERYRRLTRVISKMLRSGSAVRDILPRDEGHEIRTLLRDGNLEDAARMAHDAIMRLEKYPMDLRAQPGRPGRQKPIRGTRRPSRTQMDDQITSVPILRLNIHHMTGEQPFDNVLKIVNPVIDAKNRRLYISGTKSTSIGIVDLDKDKLIETFDIGVPGGFLLLDSKTGDLYVFQIDAKRFFKIDISRKSATEVSSLPPYLSMPEKGSPKFYKDYTIKRKKGYPFQVGYLQNENASYGLIEIKDSSGKEIGQIKHGPEGLHFAIDSRTGKLYATNTGDSSISVFDLNNQGRKIKDIDVGTSVHEIVLNPKTGGLYIRNRLGGSTIFYYDQDTKALHPILNENIAGPRGIGMWPTKMIYCDDKLYVLSHYAGRVDVIDTTTHNVAGRIPLNPSYKPRTDAVSTMVMDKKRHILYAAFPELRELVVVDAKTLRHIKTLKVGKYDTSARGPANLVLSIDEKLNRLYVYIARENRLNVYNSRTYALEKDIPIDAGRIKQVMVSNPEKGVLYLGEKILDASTLEIKGSFPKGERVIAFDNSRNRVYLADKIRLGPGKNIEKVYEYEGASLKKVWTLSPILSIPSSFAFDFSNNTFYVGYFESAMLEAFDLTSGETPTSEPGGAPLRKESRKGPMGGRKGRCGDGICQPIEREKGVCPEDCG